MSRLDPVVIRIGLFEASRMVIEITERDPVESWMRGTWKSRQAHGEAPAPYGSTWASFANWRQRSTAYTETCQEKSSFGLWSLTCD